MAWLFKPGIPADVSITYDGQLVYPSLDLEINDNCIQYISNITFVSTSQLEIKHTGFVPKAFLLSNVKVNTLQFSFTRSPRWLVEQLHSLAKGLNSSGLWLRFNDTFFTGSSGTPVIYYCRWKNILDFIDESVLMSSCTLDFYASDPNPDPPQLLEFQKVIDIPVSTLQWDLQIDNTSVLHEYARQI